MEGGIEERWQAAGGQATADALFRLACLLACSTASSPECILLPVARMPAGARGFEGGARGALPPAGAGRAAVQRAAAAAQHCGSCRHGRQQPAAQQQRGRCGVNGSRGVKRSRGRGRCGSQQKCAADRGAAAGAACHTRHQAEEGRAPGALPLLRPLLHRCGGCSLLRDAALSWQE